MEINQIKNMQDIYTKNTILLREDEELNKRKNTPCSVGTLNTERCQFSFKMIFIQQNFPYKPSICGSLIHGN